MTNNIISALNSLHTRNPQSGNSTNHSYSSSSLRSVANIHSSVGRYVSRLAPSFGQSSDDTLFTLPAGDLADSLTAPYVSTTPALPLSADKVDLPSQGGASFNFWTSCLTIWLLGTPDHTRASFALWRSASAHDARVF